MNNSIIENTMNSSISDDINHITFLTYTNRILLNELVERAGEDDSVITNYVVMASYYDVSFSTIYKNLRKLEQLQLIHKHCLYLDTDYGKRKHLRILINFERIAFLGNAFRSGKREVFA